MFKGTKIFALMSALGLTSGHLSFGSCPEVEYMKDFDIERYSGKWYQYEVDWWNFYALGQTDCITAYFEQNDFGNYDLSFRGDFPIEGYLAGIGTLYDCKNGGCDPTVESVNPMGETQATMGGTQATMGGTQATMGGTQATMGGTQATMGGTQATMGGTQATMGGT